MAHVIGMRSGGVMVLALAAALAGCSAERPYAVQVRGTQEGAAGPLAVDVQNKLGEVDVIVDKTATEPMVEAVVMADSRPMGALDRDSAFRPWAAAEESESDGRRVLRVLCTPQENQAVRPVYVRVVVPACDGVRVRNAGGPVRLRDVGGTIDVETIAGTKDMWSEGALIDIRTTRPITEPVSLVSADGEILISFPDTSTGAFTVSSPTTAANLASPRAKLRTGNSRTNMNGVWTGVLNGGENPLTLKSPRAVRISTVAEPLPYPPKQSAAAETSPE